MKDDVEIAAFLADQRAREELRKKYESELAAKDAEIATNAAELAAKDAEMAAKDAREAALVEENRKLKALLASKGIE